MNAEMAEVPNRPRLDVRNMGEPIKLTDINVHGIAAEHGRGGDQVSVMTRLVSTSDQELFHLVVPNLASVIAHSLSLVGRYDRIDRADVVLLVMHPDNTGELWLDSAAMMHQVRLKRPGPLKAGTVLFENDIADVTDMWFPHVQIGPQDRIICLFREGWRFGFLFDANPSGALDVEAASRDLGSLYRRLKYADLYAVTSHEKTFGKLIAGGWFPFLELMSGEFKSLAQSAEAGFEMDDAEGKLVANFDAARLDRMFARWMERSYLKDKELILRPAINAFKARDPVSVIKIVLSEIEGALAEAYSQSTGDRTHRIEKLLDFAIATAEARSGGKDSLFFSAEFGRYIRDYTYAGFAPGDQGSAGSRNAVGHGAVKAEHYTMPRALQALLTLDQIAFYA